MERLEILPEWPATQPGRIRRAWNAVKSVIGLFVWILQTSFWASVYGSIWSWRESCYWFRLFLFTSRRFLRIEAYLALVGAFLFFGWVINENRADNMRDLLYYCYLFFTVVMVLLCMNLLPRERDENTLEILWSQPMRRGTLIFMQLVTVAVWILLMSLFVVFFFSYFSSYTDGRFSMVVFLFTTSFAVGAITVMISTLCLHGIATGLVTLLILGVHFYWLRPIGPIELFFNPIPYPGDTSEPIGWISLLFNRTITLVVAGFVLDYLFRRLRQTAKWFT